METILETWTKLTYFIARTQNRQKVECLKKQKQKQTKKDGVTEWRMV